MKTVRLTGSPVGTSPVLLPLVDPGDTPVPLCPRSLLLADAANAPLVGSVGGVGEQNGQLTGLAAGGRGRRGGSILLPRRLPRPLLLLPLLPPPRGRKKSEGKIGNRLHQGLKDCLVVRFLKILWEPVVAFLPRRMVGGVPHHGLLLPLAARLAGTTNGRIGLAQHPPRGALDRSASP